VRKGRGLFDPAQAIPSYIKHAIEGERSQWAVDGKTKKR
jgi:hypothetical protein